MGTNERTAGAPSLNGARCALLTAGCTAVATLIVCGLSLLGQKVPTLPAWLGTLSSLTSSFLLLGVVALVINAVTGLVRARYAQRGRVTGYWTALSSVFLAFTAPVVVYLFTVLWLTNALYVALCLFIVCVLAAVIFAGLSKLVLTAH